MLDSLCNRLVRKVRSGAKKNHLGGSYQSLEEATIEIDRRYANVNDVDTSFNCVGNLPASYFSALYST